MRVRDEVEAPSIAPWGALDTTDALTSQMPGSHQMKLQLQCGRGGIRSYAAFDDNEQVVRASPRFLWSESLASITCICWTSRLGQMGCVPPSSCQKAAPWARRGEDEMGGSGGSSRLGYEPRRCRDSLGHLNCCKLSQAHWSELHRH